MKTYIIHQSRTYINLIHKELEMNYLEYGDKDMSAYLEMSLKNRFYTC